MTVKNKRQLQVIATIQGNKIYKRKEDFMNATEGLQYLASSLGLRINPEQNAASGERNGYPFIITVEQTNELLVQFQAHTEDDNIKNSMDTTIDGIKAQYGSIVYGNFSGKRANLGFQTDSASFEADAYSAIKQLASALSEQGCKVICDHCDKETTVSPVSLNDTIYFSCPSCSSTVVCFISRPAYCRFQELWLSEYTHGNITLKLLHSI